MAEKTEKWVKDCLWDLLDMLGYLLQKFSPLLDSDEERKKIAIKIKDLEANKSALKRS